MRGTLRMPNAMVTASKLWSGSGSASALASMNAMSCRALAARSRPTVEHLGVDVGDGDAGAGSGPLGDAEGDVAGAAGEIEHVEGGVTLSAD